MTVLAFVLIALAVGMVAAAVRHVRRPVTPPPPARPPARPPAVRRRRPHADVPHALYHYPWADSPWRRRYIGISSEPEVRHQRHGTDPADQWWMRRTTGVMVIDQWYPNEADARAAERLAIREAWAAGEDPANYHHNPGRRPRRVRA